MRKNYWTWLIKGIINRILNSWNEDLVGKYGICAFVICVFFITVWFIFMPIEYLILILPIVLSIVLLMMGYGWYKEENPVKR